jgi:hypothetical protein
MTAPGTGNSPSPVPRSPDVRYPTDYRQSVSYSCTRTLPRPVTAVRGLQNPGSIGENQWPPRRARSLSFARGTATNHRLSCPRSERVDFWLGSKVTAAFFRRLDASHRVFTGPETP